MNENNYKELLKDKNYKLVYDKELGRNVLMVYSETFNEWVVSAQERMNDSPVFDSITEVPKS